MRERILRVVLNIVVPSAIIVGVDIVYHALAIVFHSLLLPSVLVWIFIAALAILYSIQANEWVKADLELEKRMTSLELTINQLKAEKESHD